MLLQPTYVQVGYTLEINVLIWLSHIQHDSGSSIPTYLKKKWLITLYPPVVWSIIKVPTII